MRKYIIMRTLETKTVRGIKREILYLIYENNKYTWTKLFNAATKFIQSFANTLKDNFQLKVTGKLDIAVL